MVYAPDAKTPIQIGNLGPLLLLDNWIVSKASPVVKVNPQGGLLAEGNTFEGNIAKVEQAIQANPKALILLVIGEMAGQVKATTGGGIYYGLLAARLAAETVSTAFATGCFTAEQLCAYERAWKSLLADELTLGFAFRKCYGWLSDRQMHVLLRHISRNGLQDAIQRKADFDWHGKLIIELGKRLLVRPADHRASGGARQPCAPSLKRLGDRRRVSPT
jgi:flavin-dependent dehydrogenase